MELSSLGQTQVLRSATADVVVARERARQRRIRNIVVFLALLTAFVVIRDLGGHPIGFGLPHLPSSMSSMAPALVLVLLLGVMLAVPMIGAGKSPHVTFRADEIDVSFDDVRGATVVVEEVVKSLNLFLAYKTFQERMGGNPRRAILFEGPPGTGKTYLAKAMAKEAGVPFLFVSSSAFQSMYYGQTNRKIRSYFKALRAAARREGGAIGFIEEIDAIGASRSGMGSSTQREGISGVVNELLIQLQSFDQPPSGMRLVGWGIDLLNRFIPSSRRLRKPRPSHANVLVIGATNRAADLDPALLRPGRFDRSIYFDLPSRAGRRDIIDYYLAKKSHHADLDDPVRRDTLAAMTLGYSPVMIEHLFDEALVWALRRGAEHLNWGDIQQAKMTEEIGLAQPVAYTEAERRTIATHESGHATVAYLVGAGRKLDVLSVIKRKDALGLLAHSDTEERFTQTRTEILALIQIAFGGLVAEELFFGETSTGVAGDLQMATTAAAQMVGTLGMAGSLVSLDAAASPGGANIVAKVLSTDDGRQAVEKILDDARSKVRSLLADNLVTVEALRDALLDRDELVGDEITAVITAAREAPVSDQTVPEIIDLR
ncbi:MAG: cell division protease FtsH [Acidimicrobiaceae bacterium]|jgi:cell division protease FtsH|nr:cell division protease FtsH [Acidimicrobiaceae bacterium]MDQ1377676.1 cell division protease FtsH [Acidimicrobiaceae bacterium]MDQ1399791.1 cell division protease FtsH [Acidimicrobiaceae bacterium]MDQ1411706.1 cell division protease FtsH [Acidimicrobiaceae bacterium]